MMKAFGAIFLGAVVLLVLSACGTTPTDLGGSVYNRVVEFSEGITVDGTTVISGSGDFTVPDDLAVTDALSTTGDASLNDGTGTTTLQVGGTVRGTVCWDNGTSMTYMWFSNNSATPRYATSTACPGI